MKQIICNTCKALVPVVDRTIQVHDWINFTGQREACPESLEHYASPRGHAASGDGTTYEILAHGPIGKEHCNSCGNTHAGYGAIVKVTHASPGETPASGGPGSFGPN